MARRPEPLPLKILKGRSEGKDRRGYEIPTAVPFERGEPYKPPWLSPYARELWERIAPGLTTLDLLKPEDFTTFVAYCECWSTYRVALETARREGVIKVTGPSKMVHKHPAVGVMEACNTQLLKFAAEFGLTPRAEVALATPRKTDDADDPFAAPTEASDTG